MPFFSITSHYSCTLIRPRSRNSCYLILAFKSSLRNDVENVAKIINDHPFSDYPLNVTLRKNVPQSLLSTGLVEGVLGRLFAAHSNGLKALEFFRFSLLHPNYVPSSDAFEKTLHILARMRYFEKAWELMSEISGSHPCLLTVKSMSILLARIAKFGSFKDTLAAFDKMEKEIFVGKPFGADEFNALLRALCTQRRNMKDAHHVFVKMRDRFPTNTKTMNILLLGFKESGDITSVELFYHDLRRRGFQPNGVTYSIRIDAFCKKGYIADGVRLLAEMERANHQPTVEILTTLIHGAGVARNAAKASEYFSEIGRRNLQADIGAYNALVSAFVKCRELKFAVDLMSNMEEKGVASNDVTYHTVLLGLMRSGDTESVAELCRKMMWRNFVPKAGTMVMVMKFLCVNEEIELGLLLWSYVLEKGYCPHRNALHFLVIALCARRRVEEALECCKKFLARGMVMKADTYQTLQRSCLEDEQMSKLKDVDTLMSKLLHFLPLPKTISSSQ